jgi:S1-C subfamily serine protease
VVLVCLAGPARAEVQLAHAVDYYDVTGTTAQEIRASLDRLGPTWTVDGKRYDSAVVPKFAWEYRFGPTARGCMMKSVTVTLRIVTTTPRLKADSGAPPALQKAFAAYSEKLKEYDRNRAEIALEIVKRLEDGILGLPPQPNCLELKPMANHLAGNLEKELSNALRDYVRKTDAGRQLGAVFPPPETKPAPALAAAPRGKSARADAPDAPAPKAAPKGERSASGSGFFITRDGLVVTNAHVIEGCSALNVRTAQGAGAPATVLAQSQQDDLAVLKSSAPAAQIASLRVAPAPRAGESVVAYGFPLSGLLSSTGNATTGSISALAGLRNDARHMQISAPVQPGNSGGPLVDMSGNVIGVIFSKLDALRVARAIKDIPQNINFAIKASVAANFLDANGVKYASAQPGKDLPVPDVVERAMAFAVHVRCAR